MVTWLDAHVYEEGSTHQANSLGQEILPPVFCFRKPSGCFMVPNSRFRSAHVVVVAVGQQSICTRRKACVESCSE